MVIKAIKKLSDAMLLSFLLHKDEEFKVKWHNEESLTQIMKAVMMKKLSI